MSSDDAPTPSQNKHTSSSFADVFKTLAAARPKSQSPVSHPQSSGGGLLPEMEGRRGSRVTFGFESLHRGSVATGVSESPATPSFDTVLQNISQDQPLNVAIEEAQRFARSLYGFNSDQAYAVWEAGAYLLDQPSSTEARTAGSALLENIAGRQDLSHPSRQTLFNDISRESAFTDVIPSRVKSLISLSDYGRKLDFTDEPVLPIVASWVVPLYELTAAYRSKVKRAKGQRPNGVGVDESVLGELFQLIVDIITLQRHPPGADDINLVLGQSFAVCRRTSAVVDIKNSLAVFDAVISTSAIPDDSFIPLLEVLCSIHASVKSLAGPTSRAVRSLAKSEKQPEMVSNLHGFLLDTSERPDRNLNVTRGAVDIFRDLLVAYGQDGMPEISFDELVASLKHASLRHDGRIDTDILEVCLNALQGEFVSTALQHDWAEFVEVMLSCSQRVCESAPTSPMSTSSSAPAPTLKANTIDDVKSNIAANVTRISAALEAIWPRLDNRQKNGALRLLASVHQVLTPSQSDLILRFVGAEKLCYPAENPRWTVFVWRVINDFILAREKPAETRVLALAILKEAYFSDDDAASKFCNEGFINSLATDFVNEDVYLFLEELISLFIDITADCSPETFKLLVNTLSSPMNKDEKQENLSPTAISSQPASRAATSADVLIPSLSNVTASGLVRIFLKSMQNSPPTTSLVFEKLVDIARSPERPSDSRLTALKLLFRLRCDSAGSVYVVQDVNVGHLASVLSRTIDVTSKSSMADDSSSSGKNEEPPSNHMGRLSLRDPISGPITSLNIRGSSQRTSTWVAPVWTGDGSHGLQEMPSPTAVGHVYAFKTPSATEPVEEDEEKVLLKVNLWLEAIITLLQREKDWDVYSYILAYVSPQLMNRDLFNAALPQIKLLRSVLCEQIKNETFHEPLGWTGVKKGHIAICIFEALTMLVSFHHHFAKSEQDEIVRTFMFGIGSWEGSSRGCIHSLAVCCHEMPLSVTKCLNAILDKMSKVITRSHIAVHILEFLALLARLPEVYVNLRDAEIRTVFGICLRFIQSSREQRYKPPDVSGMRAMSLPVRLGAGDSNATTESLEAHALDDLSRYVYHLTYHVMVFWFLSLKLQDRANHVSWITKRLVFTDEHGKEVIEEQSQVFIDMMQRTAYSDLGDTIPFEKFPPSESHGPVVQKSWIVGMSIVTVETACASGLSQVTKRQASGTTYATYQQLTAPVLPHQTPPSPGSHSLSDDPSTRTAVLPYHILVQMTTSAFPTPAIMQPLPLPDDSFTRRAISTFDRNDIIDGHKIGVIYIDEGQTDELQILANTHGSQAYEHFISGLGTKVSLQNPKFNPQGLHHGRDGEYTYAWRDRVTEIVYHVATMMPTNLEMDPHCVNKKQHIGNDFVNIIFNESNSEFRFDTISTQFNFINIVITPVSYIDPNAKRDGKPITLEDFHHSFYIVKVQGKPGFPELSASAFPKVVSGKNVAAFVRLIALNTSFFSLVASRGGEHVSSWQNRLREIRRLRDRAFSSSFEGPETSITSPHGSMSGNNTGTTDSSSSSGQRRNTKPTSPAEDAASNPELRANFGAERNLSIDNNVFQNLDFSRWSR